MEKLQGLEEAWLPLVIEYGSKLFLALLTLVIGWWLIGRVVKAMDT